MAQSMIGKYTKQGRGGALEHGSILPALEICGMGHLHLHAPNKLLLEGITDAHMLPHAPMHEVASSHACRSTPAHRRTYKHSYCLLTLPFLSPLPSAMALPCSKPPPSQKPLHHMCTPLTPPLPPSTVPAHTCHPRGVSGVGEGNTRTPWPPWSLQWGLSSSPGCCLFTHPFLG